MAASCRYPGPPAALDTVQPCALLAWGRPATPVVCPRPRLRKPDPCGPVHLDMATCERCGNSLLFLGDVALRVDIAGAFSSAKSSPGVLHMPLAWHKSRVRFLAPRADELGLCVVGRLAAAATSS